MRRFVIALVGLAVTACAGGTTAATSDTTQPLADTPQEISAYCQVYDETSPTIARLMRTNPKGLSFDEAQEAIDDLNAAIQQRLDAAPPSIKPAWRTYKAKLDSPKALEDEPLSEQKKYADAVESINRFAEFKCKLPGDVK